MNVPCLVVNGGVGPLSGGKWGCWALSGGRWGVGCLFHLGCGPANDSKRERGARFSAATASWFYAKAAAATNPVSRPHQATAFLVCHCLPLLPPMAWSLALLPLRLRLLLLLLRLSLQPSPSRAATTAAGAILLKASPHHSLRRRPRCRSDAIDAPSTP
jgi:hypothetical protein